MPKWFIIARMEYLKLVQKRAFLLATLGMPLLLAGIIGFSIFTVGGGTGSKAPLAYVDEAGILPPTAVRPAPTDPDQVAIMRFPDQDSATQALQAGSIQAYYLFPPDYLQSRHVQLVYWKDKPNDRIRQQFKEFVRSELAQSYAGDMGQRLSDGVELILQSPHGQLLNSTDAIIAFLLPFVLGMFFVFIVMGSAGYLLQAVSVEKENRMVEVLFTSASPWQIIAGKALGLMGVSLTQVLIWVGALLLGLNIAAQRVAVLQGMHLPWAALGVIAIYFVPTYAVVAAIMITIGSITNELQQAQQIGGLVNLFFLVPFFFIVLIFTDPGSPLLVVFTLFPTTALSTIAMRWGVSTIPLWQLVLSWLLLVGTAGMGIFVASRVFRTAMLRYGQPLPWQGLLQMLRKGD
ncbi:MAG: ABC transporter permease [Chloroflexi bacterium]|nr:ABC transporter permease [Chloroflexota bacterium]